MSESPKSSAMPEVRKLVKQGLKHSVDILEQLTKDTKESKMGFETWARIACIRNADGT